MYFNKNSKIFKGKETSLNKTVVLGDSAWPFQSEDYTLFNSLTSPNFGVHYTDNIKAVQEHLGHKDLATTAKVYAHIYGKMREHLEKTFKNI